MHPVQSYRDLIAWQKSMDLVVEIYSSTQSFPRAETYGLMSQLRRAAVSIPSNIAEGHDRLSTGEYKQFPGHARGSLVEVETQILIFAKARLSGAQPINQSAETYYRNRENPYRTIELSSAK
jgi:four helix bundle protein